MASGPNPIKPTLFDRLVADLELEGLRVADDEDRLSRQEDRSTLRQYWVPRIERFNEQALRQTVKRELNWLLNTTNLGAAIDLEPYPQVQSSVLNFGVAEMTGKSLERPVLLARCEEIREAIVRFEPRIDPSVSVTLSDMGFERENAITFLIQGDITNAVEALPVVLKTDIELDSGSAAVRE
jgi:type VI secretion system protein ImpF